MTSAKTKPAAARSSRSIGVYQRLAPGKPPSRVQILRSAYASTKADGMTFGRTANTYLHSVASGTTCLAQDDESKLRSLALSESDIARIKARLAELAGPARAHAEEYRREEVARRTQELVNLAAGDAGSQSAIWAGLRIAFGDSSEAVISGDVEAQPKVVLGDQSPLDLAVSVLDGACKALVDEASRYRDAGLRLTNQRSVDTAASPTAHALDRLQARANRIRRELFPAFEVACKVAGLMVSKNGG